MADKITRQMQNAANRAKATIIDQVKRGTYLGKHTRVSPGARAVHAAQLGFADQVAKALKQKG